MCRKFMCLFILVLILWLNCSTCLRIYLKNASLDQRPIIMIRKGGTSSRAIAMAPPDLIECVPKSPFFTPRLAYPIDSAALSIAFIISLLVMFSSLLFLQTHETGVSLSVPGYDLILLTIAAHVLTGHMISWFVLCCVTRSNFSSFFCFSNVIDTKSARCKSGEL